jgi:hypothetical protein
MTTTLIEIQKLARHYARNNSLDIDDAASTGLAVTNKIYRGLISAFTWPEFLQTLPTTSTPTVSGTEAYAWAFASAVKMLDVRSVEVGSDASNTEMVLVMPAPTERQWNEAAKAKNGQPVYYMRKNDGGTEKIFLRPVPGYSTGIIQATGVIEPTALANGGSTGFDLLSTDDAFALLIAADWLAHDMDSAHAAVLVRSAQKILSSIWGKENVTEEILSNIIGA